MSNAIPGTGYIKTNKVDTMSVLRESRFHSWNIIIISINIINYIICYPLWETNIAEYGVLRVPEMGGVSILSRVVLAGPPEQTRRRGRRWLCGNLRKSALERGGRCAKTLREQHTCARGPKLLLQGRQWEHERFS